MSPTRLAPIIVPVFALFAAGLHAAGATEQKMNLGDPSLWLPPVQQQQTLLPPRAPEPRDADAATYDRCLGLAKTDPTAAHNLAESWVIHGGAHPAEHCLAVSLIGLKQYKEGAARLEKLQQAMIHAPATLRADVLDQAAQAWLLAGDPGRAYTADGQALALRPNDNDLLVDRAEAAGAAGWYDKAIVDLDKALKAAPTRVDALIFRASAHRALGRLDPAFIDINKALDKSPDSVPALLERGYINAMRGDATAARRDWQRVAALDPNGGDGDAAKNNIARLEAAAKNDPDAAAVRTAPAADKPKPDKAK
ncbi:MAG: hypothetical protein JO001_13390 [Alphaproteobacteria bacterium]|nr:hypothetical protein [Alphaproteobacteria bacterium]